MATKKKKVPPKYTYVMHVTETVENQVTITSERKLSYDDLTKRAEEARVAGKLTLVGVSDVAFALDEAKPGGTSALAKAPRKESFHHT